MMILILTIRLNSVDNTAISKDLKPKDSSKCKILPNLRNCKKHGERFPSVSGEADTGWDEVVHGTVCTSLSDIIIEKLLICQNGQWLSTDEQPVLSCPTINIVYTDKNKLTAEVFWSNISAFDKEDGELKVTQIQGRESGSNFTAGNYKVTFIATDSRGQIGSCFFQFIVKAVTCNPPTAIDHGILVCSSTSYIYESKCAVSCDNGYESEVNSTTCQANKTWTAYPQCLIKTCPVVKAPDNSEINCSNSNLYGSVCYIKCNKYFEVEGVSAVICQDNQTWSNSNTKCIASCLMPQPVSSGYYVCDNGLKIGSECTLHCLPGFQPLEPLKITCNSTLTWSEFGTCLDFEKPQFPDGCTDDIEVFASPLGQKTLVNYDIPNAMDNSYKPLFVRGVPAPNSEFLVGSTIVNVSVSDASGNTATCHFNVHVKCKILILHFFK
ncbi:hypothetical protein Btru_036868 [Bulinus truncatus]|nr:hypothetical protein Btru_036868 [Bulinus truncatus]